MSQKIQVFNFSINNLESNIMLPSELSLNNIFHISAHIIFGVRLFGLCLTQIHSAFFGNEITCEKSQKGIRKICTEIFINKNSLLKKILISKKKLAEEEYMPYSGRE